MRIEKKAMMEVLHREHAFSDMFVAYLLTRNIRYEEDLVDPSDDPCAACHSECRRVCADQFPPSPRRVMAFAVDHQVIAMPKVVRFDFERQRP
jgi:hypothetical protein